MNSAAIIDHIESWAKTRNFDAPYGILTGEHTTKSGRKYLSITFGRARTLDATVEVYNRNWLVLRSSRHGRMSYRSLDELQTALDTL